MEDFEYEINKEFSGIGSMLECQQTQVIWHVGKRRKLIMQNME